MLICITAPPPTKILEEIISDRIINAIIPKPNTLGSLGIVSGISLLISKGRSIYGFPEAYQWIGQGELFYIKSPMLFTGLLLIIMHIILKKTIFGLNIYAVGGNENSANLVGIPSKSTKFFAFLISLN